MSKEELVEEIQMIRLLLGNLVIILDDIRKAVEALEPVPGAEAEREAGAKKGGEAS